MFAGDAADVAVAGIVAVSSIIGACLTLYGVVFTVKRQVKPKIVDLDTESTHRELAAERERRIQAESERDVWRQVALDAQHRLRDS